MRIAPAHLPGHRLPSAVMSLLLVAVAAAVAACGGAPLVSPPAPPDPGAPKLTEPETAFYSMLENAARQQRIHVAMYRETFAAEADAQARRNTGTIASSVSELAIGQGGKSPTFRAVYANNLQRADAFSIGRCLDGTAYRDDVVDVRDRPKTLDAAASRLSVFPKGDLRELTTARATDPCAHFGVTSGSATGAMARLSDGVIPVTLTPAQAANWADQLRAARLFTVRDEGTETRDGTTLRRISFAPAKPDDYTVNHTLAGLYAAATAPYRDRPEPTPSSAEDGYRFVPINPVGSGGVSGFYLFDPARNLPVYSELRGTNPDKPATSRPNATNIARTKQSYEFPAELSMTLDTPLAYFE